MEDCILLNASVNFFYSFKKQGDVIFTGFVSRSHFEQSTTTYVFFHQGIQFLTLLAHCVQQ